MHFVVRHPGVDVELRRTGDNAWTIKRAPITPVEENVGARKVLAILVDAGQMRQPITCHDLEAKGLRELIRVGLEAATQQVRDSVVEMFTGR